MGAWLEEEEAGISRTRNARHVRWLSSGAGRASQLKQDDTPPPLPPLLPFFIFLFFGPHDQQLVVVGVAHTDNHMAKEKAASLSTAAAAASN